MSAISAPMPASIGITSIADRHQRPTQQRRKVVAKTAQAGSIAVNSEFSSQHSSAPPFDRQEEDASLPADTLFAVALIANQMPLHHTTIDEVMLRVSHEWIPPDSEYQLTDKTI